ncbi:hypothetical protein RHMOL_Rhmol05G0117400 [Rhododendron molle]|uniref:Uncharacterized protein n=1 Tax=Rhododendron molle TaxID=49168 RepID=A0ACC0NN48_RHOML|nr:hypothetical protein RHMOL_Rhmol05G0117400 [Rhododendron molle]
MVAAGSRGRTLEHVLALLGAQDINEIKSSASAMMAAAAGCGGGRRSDEGGDGLVLCMVNGAWVDMRFPLIGSYKEEVLKGIYACNAITVDFQKQVDEKGTEAAVITLAEVVATSKRAHRSPKLSFIADHPFLFMIKEEMSGLFFFMRAVLNPSL